MFGLSSGSINISKSFSNQLQLLGFTSFSGSFSRMLDFSVNKSNTPTSNPDTFTKVFALNISGNPNTTIDLTNVTLANGQANQTITPKGIMMFCEWSSGNSGEVKLSKGDTDGYTGAYDLGTNTYRVNQHSRMVLLFGYVGNAPSSTSKTLKIEKTSGDNPSNTYLIIWGD